MNKFDPSSMPVSTSPVVRALRTFVEQSIEAEVDDVSKLHGINTAEIAEASLRTVIYHIFHHNQKIHEQVKEDPKSFDEAIEKLFGITEPCGELASKE